MTHRLFILLTSLLTGLSARAQERLRLDLDTARIPTAFKSFPRVTRFEREHTEITGPGRYIYSSERSITVMHKEETDPLGDGVWYDKFRRVIDFSAYVYDAHGKLLRKLGESDAVDLKGRSGAQFYDDTRIKILEASHNEYPYTVIFKKVYEVKSTFQYPEWVPGSLTMPVQESVFDVVRPAAVPIKYECLNGVSKPEETQVDGKSRLVWKSESIKPVRLKPAAPKGINARPHVRLMQPTFDYAGYKGTSEDWQHFGGFLYDLFRQRQELPAADVAKIKELTASAKTQRQKASIAYQYLQNSTRYVAVMFGIGGFQPMTPTEVRSNGYGECKALSNFMVGMLDTLGIEAYHAIVYAGPDYREAPVLNAKFPESQANHCIAMAVLDGDSTWFECTSDVLTPGDLGDFTENRQAILLTPKGGVLVNTPVSTAEKNRRLRTATGKLTPEGSLEISFAARLKGDYNSDARGFLNQAPSTQHEQWFRDETQLPTFQLQSVDYGSYTTPDTVLTMKASVVVPQYATRAGNRLLIKLAALSRSLPPIAADSARTEPVWLRRPLTEVDEMSYVLPQGYRLSRTPDPIVIDGPCGRYRSTVDYNPETHTVTYRRSLVIDRFRLPASDFESVRQFLIQVGKADDAKLVLMKGT